MAVALTTLAASVEAQLIGGAAKAFVDEGAKGIGGIGGMGGSRGREAPRACAGGVLA